MVPSNVTLIKWLGFRDLTLADRPDIVRGIIEKRHQENAWVRDTDELRRIVAQEPLDVTGKIDEITNLIMEVSALDEQMRFGIEHRVRRVLEVEDE